jgi:dihydrofolate reductase
MELHLIVAHDRNLLIGSDGKLPWYLPDDLRHFKKTTMGYPVLMGRGVFEEIGCKPLPGRKNVVLTSRTYAGIQTFSSVSDALKYLNDEPLVFVIGGAQVYRALIDACSRMYITEVDGVYHGDVYFPEYRHRIGIDWKETYRKEYQGFHFVTYERISLP